ncbi:MAG TPA: hypothetical protein VLT35_00835 [Methanocella sp.]|nr:hypothetical protein [Methanocella sp.]
MKCRACGKEIGADSSIGMSGHTMCLACGARALKDAGVDVTWLGLDHRLRRPRRRHHPGQASLALFASS